MPAFEYKLLKTDGKARLGEVHTAHGVIRTPAFMPVGTAATVKGMRPEEVKALGSDIILGNTYHLFLRPGHELIKELGGLHKFMNWPGPILTDSGGYQVFSLADSRKITEEGVTFRSHIDGDKKTLTPENSTEIQRALDATITMAFDECTPYPAEVDVAADSMRMSMRWAKRSRDAFVKREGYGQFGIMQGGMHPHLRKESMEALEKLDFEGYAIGGLAVGEPPEMLAEMTEVCADLMPTDKPRYLMGVGYPSDIIRAVLAGVDMFDCVLPTRNGRNGQGYTSEGLVKIKLKTFERDPSPLDPNCECNTCKNYSKSYLRHLYRADEMLAGMLITHHNIHFYQQLMQTLRQAISDGNLQEVATELLKKVR